MNEQNIIKRLSIIKLLYKIGVEQSKGSEMTSFFSILSFHDSVEMFLKLAAEKNNKKDCQHFMEYWEVLPDLTLKESMRNLNSTRVNLKHKGSIPGKIEIETSRVNTTDFFEQNTNAIFEIEFSEISLFELIKYEKPKEYLITAKVFIDQNDFENSVAEGVKAFYELLYQYKISKKGERHFSTPFELIKTVTFRNNGTKTPIDQNLSDAFKIIQDNFKNLEQAIEVLSLGIDYKKYIKFSMLTSRVPYRNMNGEWYIDIHGKKEWTKETAQFIIDFVVDSALILQEFDFEYSDLDKVIDQYKITFRHNLKL